MLLTQIFTLTMNTKLIELDDNIMVEVEIDDNQLQQLSGGFAEKVSSRFDNISQLLMRVSEPVIAAWKMMHEKNAIEQVEIELGINFEAEGHLYIAKLKSNANLNVKLIFKSPPK
jgi:hypothetical protein